MDKISVGIIAHVDAGKTTLSEAMLYLGGTIRRKGRVDSKDAFLDTFSIEKQRGITVFSKCARIDCDNKQIILVDTPGHVDFSAEAERTLTALDAAILVISGAASISAHSIELWKLLRRNNIPTFIFINKSDLAGFDKDSIMSELVSQSDCMVDFTKPVDEMSEDIAACDEELMNLYFDTGKIPKDALSRTIMRGGLFPCFSGSALNLEGVQELLDAISEYVRVPEVEGNECKGVLYKIAHDEKNNRLSYIKITNGTLKAKSMIDGEKINEIRLYNGDKYVNVQEVERGDICAVTGLSVAREGRICAGRLATADEYFFKPVLSYCVSYPEGIDPHRMLDIMKVIEDEQPECRVEFHESTGEIGIMLMGEIQTEILANLIAARYGIEVTMTDPRIAYKETISGAVNGHGHYEPLKHYADVRLRIEGGEPGSGVITGSELSEDELDRNWQRLILTHLNERAHAGVLTGSPLTDVKITLVGGRAHLKHTEGGDFREATYRAVRQGLMQAESHLLEPYYEYVLTVPDSAVGRAIGDIENMCGTYSVEAGSNGMTRLRGKSPVATMNGYSVSVASYTSGAGRLELAVSGYEKCHNEEETVAASGYNPEADTDNPVHSIYCSHGAGHVVRWDEMITVDS